MGHLSEYEQWLLNGDVDVAVGLLRRIAGQATRTNSFPPPRGYSRWSEEAIDELLAEMIEKKGTSFLLDLLTKVDNQGSAERYLLKTVRNFLVDQAKSTPVGKLRSRLDTLLGQDPRFDTVAEPDRGWRLADGGDQWWQGDPTVLHRAALQVRGVSISSWNTSGPTPRLAREAIITVTLAVLTAAGGIVRAQDLARALLERFRHEIAPETVVHQYFDELEPPIFSPDEDLEHVLSGVTAQQLWKVLTSEQRAIVPYLTIPDDAAQALGIGPREAVARREQVFELVRLATVDDPCAEEVVVTLLEIARLPGTPSELARPSAEQANDEGRTPP